MVQDGATTRPKYHSGDFRWLCSAHHSCGAREREREREKTKRKGEDRWNPWLKVLKARLWGHTACSRCVCVKYKKAFPLWSLLLRQAVIFPLCFSTHRLPRPAPPTEVRTTLLLRDNISAFPYSSFSSSSSPLSQSVCLYSSTSSSLSFSSSSSSALASFSSYVVISPFFRTSIRAFCTAEKERTDYDSRIFTFLFPPSPLPVAYQPTAVMEALEGGSSSALTSRSTKRNGMKRNETRTEAAFTPNDARGSFSLPLYFLFSLSLSPCMFFLFAREKCNSACIYIYALF